MADEINVTVNETTVRVALGVTDPTGITGSPAIGAVKFTWDQAVNSDGLYYMYDLNIGGTGYSGSWTDLHGHALDVMLTNAQRHAVNKSVKIKIKKTDGITESSVVESSSVNALIFDLGGGEAPTINDLALSTLASEVTDRMFTDDTKDGSELKADSIGTAQYAPGSVDNAAMKDDAISVSKLTSNAVSLAKMAANSVDSPQFVDGSIDAVHIATDAVETAKIKAANVLLSKLATEVTDKMFDSNAEHDNLITMLETAVPADYTDEKILSIGTLGNLGTNKVAVKTDLELNNVENKNGPTLIANELDDTALNATTTAILDAEVISRINDQQAATLIAHKLKCQHIRNDGDTVDLFTTVGNLKIGVDSAGTVRTAANIIAAISAAGLATNLDLANPASGQDFDDLPDGTTHKKITAAKDTAAGYAVSGLHTTGANKVGVYDGSNTAVAADIVHRVGGRRTIWADYKDADPVTSFDVLTHTGTGGWVAVRKVQYIGCRGDDILYFTAKARSDDDHDGVMQLKLYDSGDVLIATSGVPQVLDSGGYQKEEIDVGVAGLLTDGELYYIVLELKDDAGDIIDIEGGVFSAATTLS